MNRCCKKMDWWEQNNFVQFDSESRQPKMRLISRDSQYIENNDVDDIRLKHCPNCGKCYC